MGGIQRVGESRDREPGLGLGNLGEEAEWDMDTGVSLLQAGRRESILVWQGEERDGEQDRARAVVGPGMETRKILPRWIWGTLEQSQQQRLLDIRELGMERWAGSWAGRRPRVPQ